MNLEKASSAIKAAFFCGIFSTAVTLIATLIALSKGGMNFAGIKFSAFTFIDVALVVTFTVGLFFKSRICATLMVVYFMLCKYVQWSVEITPFSFFVGLVFLYYYLQGARGAFAYHKLKNEEANLISVN